MPFSLQPSIKASSINKHASSKQPKHITNKKKVIPPCRTPRSLFFASLYTLLLSRSASCIFLSSYLICRNIVPCWQHREERRARNKSPALRSTLLSRQALARPTGSFCNKFHQQSKCNLLYSTVVGGHRR